MPNRVTLQTIQRKKAERERIVMVTCYDFAFARLVDAAGVDVALVGDSLGDNVLGYDSTIPVTLDEMIHHTRAVSRGIDSALVVADMPFMTYQVNAEQALVNAGRLMKEAGAKAVKLEGGESIGPTAARLTSAGIPVMGHLGFTPQSVHQLGGYRVQGRTPQEGERLARDLRALEEAGCFAVVLELIPAELAATLTQNAAIPTIGIGAGPDCDGQVQVLHDLLGLYPDRRFRHARRYTEAGTAARDALIEYANEVRSDRFLRDGT